MGTSGAGGGTPVATTNAIWAKSFGPGNQLAAAHGVAIDASGDVIVGGDFNYPVDLGSGPLSNGGAFITKLDPTGHPLWGSAFGTHGTTSSVSFIAVDGSGNILFAGAYTGTIDLGGGPLTPAGAQGTQSNSAIFVGRLDSGGHHVWSKTFGDGTGAATLASFSLDKNGGILLGGTYGGTITFGGSTLAPVSPAKTASFVAKLDATSGAHVWTDGFPMMQGPEVAADGSGNAIFTGGFQKSIDVGGGALSSKGGYDIVAAKLDSHGTLVWSKSFGGSDDDVVDAMAVDSAGGVALAGTAADVIDFGQGALNAGAFMVKLGSSGAASWSQSFSGTIHVQSAAIDPSSNIFLAGTALGDVHIGSRVLAATGQAIGAFAFKMDASGNPLWVRRGGEGSGASGLQIAVNAGDSSALAGTLRPGSADLGSGSIDCQGTLCAFVARFGP